MLEETKKRICLIASSPRPLVSLALSNTADSRTKNVYSCKGKLAENKKESWLGYSRKIVSMAVELSISS
jgi:hypothetical protein